MYHTIEFAVDIHPDLEVSPKKPLEKVRIAKGSRLQAQLKPYVIETDAGLIEVADLYFIDGRVARGIAFEKFSLAD